VTGGDSLDQNPADRTRAAALRGRKVLSMQQHRAIAISPAMPPVGVSGLRRTVARLRQYWDFLAVLILILITMPPALLSPSTLVIFRSIALIDYSWRLDTIFKASQGVWLGRDVAFTYGPLFQWLSSAPARWVGLTMGFAGATAETLPLWGTFLAIYATLRLLLPGAPAWRRFLLLLLLSLWAPRDLRTSFDILLFALFLRGWYGVRNRRLAPVTLGAGAAFLCAAAFLYSADTGVYGVAAWMISLAAVAWESRSDPPAFRGYAVAVLAFALVSTGCVLGIDTVMAKPFDFHFWKNSWAIVSAYRWMEPFAISKIGTIYTLGILLTGSAAFVLRGVASDNRDECLTSRTGFLIGAFCFAVLLMQSALVRSDALHLNTGLFAMLLFAGTILFSFPSRIVPALVALTGTACWLLFPLDPPMPRSAFLPSVIRAAYLQALRPITQCPSGLREFDGGCYGPRFVEDLRAASSYIQQHIAAGDSMVVFPYQTVFGIASRRNVAGGVMQSYLASGAYLSQLDIRGLERSAAPAGLYVPDQPDLRVDEVTDFTRSPELWLWLFRHYRIEQQLPHETAGLLQGTAGLVSDTSRAARVSLTSVPILPSLQRHLIRNRSAVVDLGTPAWPADGADFLRLRLVVQYGPLWKLRKPERLRLQITRADGSQEMQSFVAEPNVPSDVWFYPWNEPDLTGYFAAEESQWRTDPRPAVTHLRLWITPYDWISQRPDSVVIESTDAIQAALPPKAE
jgi:hypothetical protein